MNNKFFLRVLWLLIPLLTLFNLSAWGAEVTFTAGTDVNSTKTITKSSVTLTLSSACPNLNGYSEYRIYSGAYFTIECSAGITKIVVTTNTDKGNATKLSATSGYSASGTTGTWTGDATSVRINADQGSQVRVTKIVVTTKGSSYTVTATRNNDSYGTVSVSGTTITATPSDCYQVISGTGGYTVTSGTATVSHTGTSNTLTVTPSTNCTVQVNFEKKTVNTYIDDIQDNGTTEDCDTHDTPTLTDKTPASSGTCAQQHWHFVGWVPEAYKASPRGHITNGGTSVTANGTTYYAVWSKGSGDDPESVTGGNMSSGVTSGWTTSGTGTYSGNGVKFDGAGDYVQSPDISSNNYKALTVKLKAGYNGSVGSVLTIASLNASGTVIDSEDFTPSDTYTSQTTEKIIDLSGSTVIKYIRVTMKSKTSNLGMKYCEVFTPGVTYSDSVASCCESLGSINGSFF